MGKIFGVMEANKLSLQIDDYSVSQTTLDQVFINFAKSSDSDRDSDEEEEDEEAEEVVEEVDESVDADEYDVNEDKMLEKTTDDSNQIRVNVSGIGVDESPLTDLTINDSAAFASIKNHFNSLKKTSRHIRKTSSAKSQSRKQSTRSRKSQRSKASSKRRSSVSGDAGFSNLAYEIEYKNSDACDAPIQESPQDLSTSINEDGEYFSRC